jgi:hypothetical protein
VLGVQCADKPCYLKIKCLLLQALTCWPPTRQGSQ